LADITQLRYAQLLKRVFGIKTVDPGRVVAPVIAAGYELQDTYKPESRLDRGEKLWGGGIIATNNVAGFQNVGLTNLPGSGKLTVVRRMTISFTLPTTATQPGNAFFAILAPTVGNAGALSQACTLKDARYIASAGGVNISSTQVYSFGNSGAGAIPLVNTLYATALTFGAAVGTTPFQLVIDNLEIVLSPNTQLVCELGASVLPTATWTWLLWCEGHERIADPNELITPPP
jgi:hypothetical protein